MDTYEQALKEKLLDSREDIDIEIREKKVNGKTVKLYVCPIVSCAKVMTFKGNLRVHLETHVGVKPFVCDYPGCEKRFSRAARL